MKREQIAKNIVADLRELAALTSDIDGAQDTYIQESNGMVC